MARLSGMPTSSTAGNGSLSNPMATNTAIRDDHPDHVAFF